jgi:hypothetical protein
MKHLEEYERKFQRDASKVLMAEGRIASIYEQKLRKPKDARRIYVRIWDYYEKLPSRLKKNLDLEALDAVARAHFELSDADWGEYTRLRLRWGRGNAMADEFKRSLTDKAKALEAVQKRYTQTVSFKSGDPAICALYKIGMAYHHMADSVTNAPMPRGAPPELQDAIRDELAGQALPIKEKAAEAFAATAQKARELDLFNPCSAKALAMLRDGYRPDQFPAMPEVKAEMAQQREVALGGGLLTAIQEPPQLTAAQAKDAKERAQELGAELTDLRGSNVPAQATKVTKDAEPVPARADAGSDEPEDSL